MTVLPVLLKVLNPGFLRSKSKAVILPVAHSLVGDEK